MAWNVGWSSERVWGEKSPLGVYDTEVTGEAVGDGHGILTAKWNT